MTHGALANYLDWAVDTFGYRPGDRMLQPAPICFDASFCSARWNCKIENGRLKR